MRGVGLGPAGRRCPGSAAPRDGEQKHFLAPELVCWMRGNLPHLHSVDVIGFRTWTLLTLSSAASCSFFLPPYRLWLQALVLIPFQVPQGSHHLLIKITPSRSLLPSHLFRSHPLVEDKPCETWKHSVMTSKWTNKCCCNTSRLAPYGFFKRQKSMSQWFCDSVSRGWGGGRWPFLACSK